MISAGLELPADLLSIIGLEQLGRRWSSNLSLLGSGIAILPCAWLTERLVAQAVLAMIARFFATYAMNTNFQFTVEVLPTALRGQGMALVNVMSMFSQMASPVFVYSSVLSEKAPFILIALVCLLASIPGLYLPETAGVNLPDTLQEIETFGKNDRFFWMPLLGEEKRGRKDKANIPHESTMSSEL